ncbi:hypothetical protein EON79_22930 [bacterium]|nr:MAG: hypothetical protein EON79_22930 [bacterium]
MMPPNDPPRLTLPPASPWLDAWQGLVYIGFFFTLNMWNDHTNALPWARFLLLTVPLSALLAAGVLTFTPNLWRGKSGLRRTVNGILMTLLCVATLSFGHRMDDLRHPPHTPLAPAGPSSHP